MRDRVIPFLIRIILASLTIAVLTIVSKLNKINKHQSNLILMHLNKESPFLIIGRSYIKNHLRNNSKTKQHQGFKGEITHLVIQKLSLKIQL